MMKRRGVIVEGPDCSGKSSLITRLKIAFPRGWDVLQMTHRSGDQFKRYLKVYLEADRLLLDRAHFSELVYGDLFRDSRHFTPWELETLNRIAREEFVTVLCTAPVEVLRERYAARDFPQPPTTFEETTAVRARFHVAVEPHATLVFDSDFSVGEEALERTLADVIAHVIALVDAGPAGSNPAADDTARGVDVIVVEGAAGSGRSDVARLLKASLPGWCVARFDLAADRDPFRRFMLEYSAAQRTIFDGGHLTYLATAGLAGAEGGGGALHNTLDDYVASRGILVVCERSRGYSSPGTIGGRRASAAKRDLVSRRICTMAQRYGARYCPVRTDDRKSVSELVNIVRCSIDGTATPSLATAEPWFGGASSNGPHTPARE